MYGYQLLLSDGHTGFISMNTRLNRLFCRTFDVSYCNVSKSMSNWPQSMYVWLTLISLQVLGFIKSFFSFPRYFFLYLNAEDNRVITQVNFSFRCLSSVSSYCWYSNGVHRFHFKAKKKHMEQTTCATVKQFNS